MSKNTSIKNASTKQLEVELSRRRNVQIRELETERNILNDKIKQLSGNTEVSESVLKSSKVKINKKTMSKNKVSFDKSLKERLIEIASDGRVRTTNEFMTALTNDGWKSSSDKPYYVVAAALAAQEKKNVFRRVSKGSYELVR